MAHKPVNPYTPDFRTVNKLRGKTMDPESISMKIPKSPDVFDSVYVKDYIKSRERKPHQNEASVSSDPTTGRGLNGKPKGFKIRGKALRGSHQ